MTKINEELLVYQGTKLIIVVICFLFPTFLKENRNGKESFNLQPVICNKNTHLNLTY